MSAPLKVGGRGSLHNKPKSDSYMESFMSDKAGIRKNV